MYSHMSKKNIKKHDYFYACIYLSLFLHMYKIESALKTYYNLKYKG